MMCLGVLPTGNLVKSSSNYVKKYNNITSLIMPMLSMSHSHSPYQYLVCALVLVGGSPLLRLHDLNQVTRHLVYDVDKAMLKLSLLDSRHHILEHEREGERGGERERDCDMHNIR